jgi:peptidyl-dipeptidase Dcp
MRKVLLVGASAAALLAVGLIAAPAFAQTKAAAAKAKEPTAAQNPLLAKWTGPYGGVPAFDKVKVQDFKPALEAAMAENLREVDAIANNPAKPTFKNTIEALENAGRTLNDVGAVYGIWQSTLNSPEFQKVSAEMEPKLAAFGDKITQNEKLFKRIEAVYNSPEKAKLTPEQQRLVWLNYTNFVRSGARLDAAGKKRVAEINERLATLFNQFSNDVLHDEESYTLVLDKPEDLAGLSQSQIDGAAAEAERRGLKGKWVIANTRSSVEPFLTTSTRRDLREKAFKMFVARGDNKDAYDTGKIITEVLQLRAERAKLLGYKTHAHWRLENAMAKNPENAMALMEAVWQPAVETVHHDVADMQAIADKEGAGIKIAPWDYRFYAEKVRKAKYDLDLAEVKPYLQLDKLREGMFWAAGEVYGFKFDEVTGLPVAHPDIRVWKVTRDGKLVGLWYFDPYARKGKRSGAWMNAYRNQEKFKGAVTTIVSNNSNFIKGKPGEPVLISWDDANTLFHEFGHALHGLNSDVTYPSLSGTAVARDYVEFPSQVNERWLSTPQVLNRFAVNQKGEPIPQALVDKLKKAKTFNEGFITVEYLASALVDMKLHLAGDTKIDDPDAFEAATLKELGMPEEIVMRHRTPQFLHVFSSDGYSAGYYSYLWTDVLAADAAEAFAEAPGGFYDKAVAKRLHDEVMSKGNSVDPADQYRAFRGRDPKVEALMRARGFAPPLDAKPASN